jgi:hypothetical protein
VAGIAPEEVCDERASLRSLFPASEFDVAQSAGRDQASTAHGQRVDVMGRLGVTREL